VYDAIADEPENHEGLDEEGGLLSVPGETHPVKVDRFLHD
jgi:hypothetical protein